MAVTENKKNEPSLFQRVKPAFVFLPIMTVMVFSFQNCAVDLASTTPGADLSSETGGGGGGGCDPDAQTLADFKTVLDTELLALPTIPSGKSGCVLCHGSTTGNPAANVYMLTAGDTTDTNLVKTNFCATQLKGNRVITHPASGVHTGGVYNGTDLPTLTNFVNTYF